MKTLKSPFEINWPLIMSLRTLGTNNNKNIFCGVIKLLLKRRYFHSLRSVIISIRAYLKIMLKVLYYLGFSEKMWA